MLQSILEWRDPLYCRPFHILEVLHGLPFKTVVWGRMPVCQQLGPLAVLQLCTPHTARQHTPVHSQTAAHAAGLDAAAVCTTAAARGGGRWGCSRDRVGP